MLAVLAAGATCLAPHSARADFASDCGAPTRTLTGPSSASITVAAGERLLLTGGTFTGGIDAFPSGAGLCVAGSATLSPPYVNNAAGALDVAPGGRATFPSVSVATGFDLENDGTVTFAGLNVNGAATLHNLPGATLTISSQFSPSAGTVVNDGTFTAAGGINLNTAASLTNTDVLNVNGTSTVNGAFDNSGLTSIAGALTVNGGGSFSNRCALVTTQGFFNNAASSTNEGLLEVGGAFANNGSWTQSTTGTSRSSSLANDGSITGFGRYQVSGDSRTQGSFAGTSGSDPVVVDDETPPTPPQIFDTQAGTVVNVVPGVVRSEGPLTYPAPGCSDAPRPGADLVVSKSAPPTVTAGGTITFTVTVTNNGPDPADGVEVTDTLPDDLTGVTASDDGTVLGGTVTWDLGTLARGASRELTVSGIAPASGTLVNRVAATATTPDPDPTNNDGTADSATTSTEVDPAPPPANEPPVADDLTVTGRSLGLVLGRVTATDPDAGQTLQFTGPTTGPANGRVAVLPSGGFAYVPAPGFAGHDSFDYEVCDNGDPSLCDTATVSVEITPIARDDEAQTAQGTPVLVPVTANDVPGGVLDSVTSPPTNGTVTIVDGRARYAPADGFTGTDTFTYSYCSPDAPPLCDNAEVVVEVLPPDLPPLVGPTVVTTTTGTAVSGSVNASDPEGDDLVVSLGVPPRSGTAQVSANGSFTYVPRAGFSGVDTFTVIVCELQNPALCSSSQVTARVFPVAVDDAATTTQGTDVTVAVLPNDSGAMNEPPQLTAAPGSGTARVVGRQIVVHPGCGLHRDRHLPLRDLLSG